MEPRDDEADQGAHPSQAAASPGWAVPPAPGDDSSSDSVPPGATHPGSVPPGPVPPGSAPPGEDVEMRPLDPRVRPLWWCSGVVGLLQALIPVALLDWVIPHPWTNGRIMAAVAVVGVVLVAVVPIVRYQRWRYALRAEDLWIRQGLLTVTISVIPYRRLQFVDTRQGPLDRLFGLAQLVVHTAALGTSGTLPGLDAAEAERLRETLARLEPGHDAI